MTIRELRKEKNLTQAEFAKAVGIGISSVSAYESGRAKPSATVLAKIHFLYGVNIDEEKPAPKAKQAAPATKAKQATPAPKAKKRAAKKPAEPQIIIQSPLGGEITPFAILARVGQVDKVYIRVDLNKAFWVKGTQTGSVDLW